MARRAMCILLVALMSLATMHVATSADDAPSAGTATANPHPDYNALPLVPGAAVNADKVTPPHELPHDLSPWGMFQAADWVVKSVMIGLAIASFLIWTIWLGKTIQLFFARRALSRELRTIFGQASTVAAMNSLDHSQSVTSVMLAAAHRESQLSQGANGNSSLERVSTRLTEIESDVNLAIRSGMSFLATVAATAPFIGLFGTVWGIMNSFIGISKTQTTNLAVVAPGIAEALLATAIGLVAAIPAVMLYNQLSQKILGFKRLLRETKGEVWRVVSRQADALSADRNVTRLQVAAE